jgi:hypothetical protein
MAEPSGKPSRELLLTAHCSLVALQPQPFPRLDQHMEVESPDE